MFIFAFICIKKVRKDAQEINKNDYLGERQKMAQMSAPKGHEEAFGGGV